MKNFSLLFILLLFVYSNTTAQTTYFHYFHNQQVNIDVDFKRISVTATTQDTNFLQPILNQSFSLSEVGHLYDFQNESIYYYEIVLNNPLPEIQYHNMIAALNASANIKKASPSFTQFNVYKMGLSNRFYVKLKNENDLHLLTQFARDNQTQVLQPFGFMPLWYILVSSKNNNLNAVELSNLFDDSGLFSCTAPEFMLHDLAATDDPYYSQQWGLKNTGQHGSQYAGIDIKAEDAWTLSTGHNVKIAIIDSGVQLDHEDLQANQEGGYNPVEGEVHQLYTSHGTMVAGVAVAEQNNGHGISGVAPNARFASVSINFTANTSPSIIANGIYQAWFEYEADVINCSWYVGAMDYLEPIVEQLENALTEGRNHKGAVVVFASHNQNAANVPFPGGMISDILNVGAINPCGTRWRPGACGYSCNGGSNYGAGIDIMAPGTFITTTDWNGGYALDEVGTSVAAPFVSGVAALILSANPCLTGQQVRDIIESTAQKVGGYNYDNHPERPNGTWNDEMGYGLVNAYAAVQMAQQMGSVDLMIKDSPEDTGLEPNT